MASDAEQQITWSSSNSSSIASGGTDTSDVESLSDGAIQATVMVKASNNGTPASGDTVDFSFLYTVGDPDGSSTDEYTTEEHSYTVRADTNTEDPAILLVSLPLPLSSIKIKANNNASSNGITVSATLYEQTA